MKGEKALRCKCFLLTQRSEIADYFKELFDQEFELVWENSFKDFFLKLETERPDLILIDGEMKGLEQYIAQFKSLKEKFDQIPIFVVVCGLDTIFGNKLLRYADDYIIADRASMYFSKKRLTTYAEKKKYENMLFELKKSFEELERKLREKCNDYERLIIEILDLFDPGIKERALLSREVAEFISEKKGLTYEEKEELLVAALLREIGKIALSQNKFTESEDIQFRKKRGSESHALAGEKLLSNLKSFKFAAKIVGAQYERFDGEGFPHGLRGNQMSTQELILQAVAFYGEQLSKGLKKDELIDAICLASGKTLEPHAALLLVEYIREKHPSANGKVYKIPVCELKPGMVIAEDVYSVSGTKILSKGSKITEHILAVMDERKAVDPIIGCVYVYK